jgi:hypothetical protein
MSRQLRARLATRESGEGQPSPLSSFVRRRKSAITQANGSRMSLVTDGADVGAIRDSKQPMAAYSRRLLTRWRLVRPGCPDREGAKPSLVRSP